MSEARASSPAIFVVDPPESRVAIVLRYAAAMLVVVAAFAGLVGAVSRAPPNDVASESENAVLVDLPPVEAAAQTPGSEAEAHAAAAASTAAVPPPEPPPPQDRLPDPVPPLPGPPQEPPPPPVEAAPALLPPEQAAVPPPIPDPAPAAIPQDAEAPSGADANGEAQESEDAEAQQAQLITLWQRALMSRLETAKRSLGHIVHPFGTVKVAFLIDADGRLVSEHVASGSGSPALDAAALTLVAHAAPFPTPPAGTHGADLSFVVPIRFRR